MSHEPAPTHRHPGLWNLVLALSIFGLALAVAGIAGIDVPLALIVPVLAGWIVALVLWIYANSPDWEEPGGQEHWWTMAKSLGFVVGVPVGIVVGVLVGAFFEVVDLPHSAAWGVLIGFGSGVLVGGVFGRQAARTNYRWVHREHTLAPNTEWHAVVMALNVKAAVQHYLMVRSEERYVAYAPMLVRPVAAGPLTVSGEYLSVVAALSDATTITFTGPQYMVEHFEAAASEAGVIAEEAS